ncbi:MAG: hypothetical protein ABSF26_27560 [Thermoguttaceae bacterium]
MDAIHVQGNLRITGGDRALFLFRTSYEGTVTIRGPAASREGIVGFLTRLATQSKPTLRVRDNRSVVMSDFYNEQSDQHMVFEGVPGQPERSVTIQGPKMHMFTQEPVIDIHDYAGRIYYGHLCPGEPDTAGGRFLRTSVFDRIESLLGQHGLAFQVLRHEPVYSSAEPGRVRLAAERVEWAAFSIPEKDSEHGLGGQVHRLVRFAP